MSGATAIKLEPQTPPREFLVTAFSKKPEGKNAPSRDIIWSEVWQAHRPLSLTHPCRWVLQSHGDFIQVRNLGAPGDEFVIHPVEKIPVKELDRRGIIELKDRKSKTGCWLLVRPVPEIQEMEKNQWAPREVSVPSVTEAPALQFLKRTSYSVSAVMFLFVLILFVLPKPEPDEEEIIPEEFAKVLLSPALKDMQPVPVERNDSASSASNIVQVFQSKAIKKQTKSMFSVAAANRLLSGSTLLNTAKSSKNARKMFDVKSAISRAVDKNKLKATSKSVGLVGEGGYTGGEAIVAGQGNGMVAVPARKSEVSVGLTRDQVGKTIRKYASDVRYCYEASLIRDPGFEGKLTLAFTVKPNGRVGKAKVKQSSNDHALDQCIIRKLRGWKFPKPKGGVSVDVVYPFIFKVLGG